MQHVLVYNLNLLYTLVSFIVRYYKTYYSLVDKYITYSAVLYICVLDPYNLLQLR